MHTQNTIGAFIPVIPPTVKARFSGYHITLSGPNDDVERAANGLFNYGFASGAEENAELTLSTKRITLTFYRKPLLAAIKSISEMGYVGARDKPTTRQKHDDRKCSAIRNYRVGMEVYSRARLPLILAMLGTIREDIGERAEAIENRIGRGLNEIFAEKV
jgi:hypothetical protein